MKQAEAASGVTQSHDVVAIRPGVAFALSEQFFGECINRACGSVESLGVSIETVIRDDDRDIARNCVRYQCAKVIGAVNVSLGY